MIIKSDKHLYAIAIEAGTTLTFGTTQIQLDAGKYWAHTDGAIDAIYPSIYLHIANKMSSAFPGRSFQFLPHAPANYKRRTGIRLALTSGAAIGDLALLSTTNILRKVLGFDEGDTGTIPWVGGFIDSPMSAYGIWSPYGAFDGRATSKDSTLERVTHWSSAHPEVATSIVWRERRVRELRYEYLYGCYVNGNRASYPDLALPAGLAVGDKNNCFENLWLVAGLNNSDIIVVYDQDELDLSISSGGKRYEYVRFSNRRAVEDLGSIATRVQIAHDFWSVKINYVVLGGNNYGL